jgi:hypothetical protein
MRFIATALAAVSATALSAQTTTPQQPLLVGVARVTVKPDRVQEWLDIEKKYSEAYQKGGGTFRYVYRNSAGNPYEYMVSTGIGKYANLDEKSPYAKGMTEAEFARITARRNQCVDSVRTTYERTIPELGIPAPTGAVRKLFRLTRITVRSGMDTQYLAIMKDEYLPALKKAGVKSLLVRRVEWGASRNVFTLLGRHDKFAELDEGSMLTKSLGADGAAKLLAKLRQTIASSEYLLYTYIPESSYQPPPAQ